MIRKQVTHQLLCFNKMMYFIGTREYRPAAWTIRLVSLLRFLADWLTEVNITRRQHQQQHQLLQQRQRGDTRNLSWSRLVHLINPPRPAQQYNWRLQLEDSGGCRAGPWGWMLTLASLWLRMVELVSPLLDCILSMLRWPILTSTSTRGSQCWSTTMLPSSVRSTGAWRWRWCVTPRVFSTWSRGTRSASATSTWTGRLMWATGKRSLV